MSAIVVVLAVSVLALLVFLAAARHGTRSDRSDP
jgi:hypothetical protein